MKLIFKKIYGMLPAPLLLKTPLKKYIHNKPIPRRIKHFYVKPTTSKFLADDSPIARLAFWLGVDGYEAAELKLYMKLCSRVMSVCEVGGNIGYFTVFGAGANKKCYQVYEPLPYNYNLLRKNVELNNLDFVNVYNSAVVGDHKIKSIKLFTPKQERYGAATGGFIEGAESISREVGDIFEVSTVGSSKALSGFELLKIDVEGAEFEILSKAEVELAKAQTIILVEMRRGTKNLRQWIYSYVKKYEYCIFALNEFEGSLNEINVEDIPDIILQEVYGTRDIIMCPKHKKSIVTE